MYDQRESKNSEEKSAVGSTGRGDGLFKQGIDKVLRTTLVIVGLLLIPLGVIIAILTPIIPVGLPIVILGVVLVARNASWGRTLFQSILQKYPTLERFAPNWLLKLIFGEVQK